MKISYMKEKWDGPGDTIVRSIKDDDGRIHVDLIVYGATEWMKDTDGYYWSKAFGVNDNYYVVTEEEAYRIINEKWGIPLKP